MRYVVVIACWQRKARMNDSKKKLTRKEKQIDSKNTPSLQHLYVTVSFKRNLKTPPKV